jgi:hypothetical protein
MVVSRVLSIIYMLVRALYGLFRRCRGVGAATPDTSRQHRLMCLPPTESADVVVDFDESDPRCLVRLLSQPEPVRGHTPDVLLRDEAAETKYSPPGLATWGVRVVPGRVAGRSCGPGRRSDVPDAAGGTRGGRQ